MALATLPYPSLDFVPLDILTAEEMNQIVANYTAINNATIGTNQIANSSITTPKLANRAVTSDKVDWTTLADSSSHYIKLGDITIQWGIADFGDQSFSANFWDTFNRAANQNMRINYPIAFDDEPVLMMNPVGSASPLLGICYGANDGSGSRSPRFTVYSPKGFTATVNVKIQWIAIGAKA